MKRIKQFFYKRLTELFIKFKRIKYVLILLLAMIIIYSGIPVGPTILAGAAVASSCDPFLIGFSISIGGGIGSLFSQYTGQIISEKETLPKIKLLRRTTLFLEKQAQKRNWLVIPILTIASITLIPETYLLGTIGKDISKILMLGINLTTRFFYFWLFSKLGKTLKEKRRRK
jgi:hypothetical protein